MKCLTGDCPYDEPVKCTKCGEDEELMFNIDGEILCLNCAFEKLATFNNMLRYIDSDKDYQIEFYLNCVCGSNIWADKEKVSDKVVEIVRKECLEFPNMLYDEMQEYCKEDEWHYIEWFGYKAIQEGII
jgi:hypothetical protein